MSDLSCNHVKSLLDPHPLCVKCLDKHHIPECTPDSTCDFCRDLPSDAWIKLLRTRQKRELRRASRVHNLLNQSLDKLSYSVTVPKDTMDNAAVSSALSQQSPTTPLDKVDDLLQSQLSAGNPPSVEPLFSDDADSHSDSDPHEDKSDTESIVSFSPAPLSGRTSVVNEELMEAEDPFRPSVDDSVPPTQFVPDSGDACSVEHPPSDDWTQTVMSISVPDLLKWTTEHSDFSYAATHEESRARVHLKSQPPTSDLPEPFIGLSSDSQLVDAFEKFRINYRDSDQDQVASVVGKYVSPKSDLKVNMSTYKLSDKLIRTEPMKFPVCPPSFLYPIKGNTAAPVRDIDLQHFEETFRRVLTICSNLEASMQAMVNVFPTLSSPDPFVMRSLYRVSMGLADITQLACKGFHQTVIHRRDAAIHPMIHGSRPTSISDAHLLRLRHGPSLASRHLFDKEDLDAIREERQVQSKDHLLSAAMSRLAYQQKPQSSVPKRKSPSAALGAPPSKHSKSVSESGVKPSQQSSPSQPSGQNR